VNDVMTMQSMIQMRFAPLNPKDTLRIYCVPDKSLSAYRSKNKYGFSNLPPDQYRLKQEEVQGSDELEASKK